VRAWLVSLAVAIAWLLAVTAASPAKADGPAFQRFANQLAADVSANLQILRNDFVVAPSEAKRLSATISAALNDGTGVQAVTSS
jgi:hypothetical protein